MRIQTNLAIQGVAIVTHVVNAAEPLTTPRVRAWCGLAISLLQGGVALLAHFSTPQGVKLGASE